MKIFYFVIVLFLSCLALEANDHLEEHKVWFKQLDEILADEKSMSVWWLRPTDPEWTKFKCIDIKRDEIISIIKTRRYSKNAGEYYLLEKRFEMENNDGQGFLMIFNADNAVVFKFTSQMVNKNSLEYCIINEFDIFKRKLSYSYGYESSGIILNKNIRPLIVALAELENNELNESTYSRSQ